MATERAQRRSRSRPSRRWAAQGAVVATAALGLAGLTVPASSAAMPSFTVGDTQVSETPSDSIATVKIKLSSTPTVRTTVYWTTVDDTAVAGEDYVAREGTKVFPRGVRTKFVKVKVLADTLDEDEEGFGIELSDPWHATIERSWGDVTIVDDDETPTLWAEDVEVSEGDEGATDVELPVYLSEESGRTVTVDYAVTSGTATHDKDYAISPTSGTLTFEPGETEQAVVVSVLGDRLDEADETVSFSLVDPENAVLEEEDAVLTIIDDDGPGIAVNDVSVTEGGTATFTVSLSATSPEQVTVDYATKNGTATQPGDYTSGSGTLTFSPGDKSKTVSVPTTLDSTDEVDETFSLVLSNATNSVISDAEGVGTIVDDDGPALSVGDTSKVEGDDLVFTVTLSAKSPQTVTVAYATADGTAKQPGDYTAKSGTLTFAPNETSKTVNVPTVNDTDVEGEETVLLNLSAPTKATIADGQGVGKILDNDGTSLSVNDATAPEGGLAVFTVTLSKVSPSTVKVDYVTKDGTATQPADYTKQSGTLSFAPGETTRTVSVPTTLDSTDEVDETFSLVLSKATNSVISDAEGVGTIVDDDGPALSVGDTSKVEGDDLVFTVTLSAKSPQTVTVAYATADGTAKQPGDYASGSGTLTFAPNETSKTVNVPTVNDTDVEGEETVLLNLSAPSKATIADGQGVGKILDNDGTSLSVKDVTVDEGGNAVFTVALSTASPNTVKVDYDTKDGTATNPADFTAQSGTLSFAPGDKTRTVTVPTAGDKDDEVDETFSLVLSHASNASISDAEGIGTIVDDDGPAISVGATSGVEGQDLVFTVTLSAKSPQTVTVAYATADGTAKQPGDYAAKSGTVTFAPNDTSETVSVPTVSDTDVESEETVQLNLSAPSKATIADGQGVGLIIDNDGQPVLDISNGGSDPEGKVSAFVVRLSSPSGKVVTVHYATQDGSATAPADYVSKSGTLSFAPGETAKQLVVETVADSTVEEDEYFSVALSDPVNATLDANHKVGTWCIDGNGTIATASHMTGIDGDEGSDESKQPGEIWSGGDHDVYRFTVYEDSHGPHGMSFKLALTVPDNGGEMGNLDMCVYDGAGHLLGSCQSTTGTADETFSYTWPDQVSTSDTRSFFVEVYGAWASVRNSYTLTLTR